MDDLKDVVLEFQEQRKLLNRVLKENDVDLRIYDICNEMLEQRMVVTLLSCLKLEKAERTYADGNAKHQKAMYDSLVKEGFTKKQAISILGEDVLDHTQRCSEGCEVEE